MKRLMATIILLLLMPLQALAGGDNHDDWNQEECPDNYSTQGYEHKDKDEEDCEEETTTTTEATTTTTIPTTTVNTTPIEVCREGQIITIPYNELLDSDDRIWDDFDRRDCQPPRTTVTTTIPEVVIRGPIRSVGYICPGTDGIVYELPWGTYEDMWPTPESAKLYGCPTTTTIQKVLTELPFTGPGEMSLIAGLGTTLTALGVLIVASRRKGENSE